MTKDQGKQFVIQFKSGDRDWIDAVYDMYEEGEKVYINVGAAVYEYEQADIDYIVRSYSEETLYDD